MNRLRFIKTALSLFLMVAVTGIVYIDASQIFKITATILVLGIFLALTNTALRWFVRETNQELDAIVKNMPGGIYRCTDDERWTITYVNEGFAKMFGYCKDEILTETGTKFHNLVCAEDRETVWEEVARQLQIGNKIEVEYRAITKTGELIWVLDKGERIYDAHGKAWLYCIILDITAEINERQRLVEKEQQYREAILSDTLLTYEVNLAKNRFLKGHEDWNERFGVQPTDDYEEMIYHIAQQTIYCEDIDKFTNKFKLVSLFEADKKGETEISLEYRTVCPNGHITWASCTMHLLKDPYSNDLKGIAYMKDIDEQKKTALAMQFKAERDLLTGLYNKCTTEYMIRNFLQGEDSTGNMHAFFMVDVDNFKSINDNLGHQFGDAVLSEISMNLKSIFRMTDIIGRAGGDEFIILLKDIPIEESAVRKAKEIKDAFERRCNGESNCYEMSASVGIALYPSCGTDFDQLYKNADIALYRAKSSGKNICMLYHGEESSDGESDR